MTLRTLVRAVPARRDDIGDLTTRRPLPGPGLDQVDPFLFLNHHGPQTYRPGNQGLPFGPHPHRGFETVTFILAGTLAHYDSGGHASVIEAGGVQWMTAGSGLIHAEVSPPEFKRSGGPLEILQLWINLPARLKLTAPAYSGVQAADIPAIAIADGRGTLNLIAGTFDGATGPIHPLTGVFMATVKLAAGAQAVLPAPAGRTIFLYVVAGRIAIGGDEVAGQVGFGGDEVAGQVGFGGDEVAGQVGFGGDEVAAWHLATLGDGDGVAIAATDDAVLLFGHADPIGEPVVAHGPFVMNRREEIEQAIRDYQAGKFDGTGLLGAVGG